jgi:erythromycin esterase-like protein/predicted phosphoribosyltransferase
MREGDAMQAFQNRADAGRQLAGLLAQYAGRTDVVVLALPRGGVPVAAEVAARLAAPLDVFLVRKLGVPGHPELAMGAIAEGGVRVLSSEMIAQLDIPRAAIDQIAARERLELDRRDALYRGGRERPALAGRTVILIDDGLATGASMEAAVMALREHKPARIIVAVPVGAREACARLGEVADQAVCALIPPSFLAVGQWYADFNQTSDEEVRTLLAAAGRRPMKRNSQTQPSETIDLLRQRARPLTGHPSDYDPILDAAATARVVLIGEATHGTHEFYRHRALLTGRLIAEKGFSAVAVEADWPDAYRVNRYVRGAGSDGDATEALSGFKRFPAWMWRNADVLDFVGWLRSYNEGRPAQNRAGFYGLDLYSLRASADAVLSYLAKVDPAAAAHARERYACFDRFDEELHDYARATGWGLTPSCENEAVAQLVELRRRAAEYAGRNGRIAPDDYFFAEQNARLVTNAEAYYRTMLGGRIASWNLRDRHMADTLRELRRFLDRTQGGSRVVVWAHNSHLGDARATEMGEYGELNLGQLVREEFGTDALAVGFTTHTGSVTAATAWDGPAHRRHVRPSVAGSVERLFHDTRMPRFLLPLRSDPELQSIFAARRLERAIGVIYAPETERHSHYFHARLAEQFDFVLHFDETRAVEPLERTATWETPEVAETFPTGL